MRVRYVFDEVRRTGFKVVRCAGCNRKINRQRSFTNTINPWNINADGTQRSYDEIWAHLGDLIEAWKAEPERHPRCATAAVGGSQ